MAGKIVAAQFATIGTATAAGFITIPSVAGFYKGAKVWLSKAATPSVRGKIVSVDTTGNTLGIQFIDDYGINERPQAPTYPGYGRGDCSPYATTGRIDQEEQMVYSSNDTGLV